ncbi:monosaccharide ABC transporter ATP-binding protein (CUT2 family) [Thermohydrogenium kirishiense]|nr:monosaccharide ABC transporter ATP-binding protein (CUT2 family) [Thermohydrogenium kirishiense]
MDQSVIHFKNITKFFSGVQVLYNVSFEIQKGEIHALLGENGAGKSTLLNILHGIYSPDGGSLYIEGEKVKFSNPAEALNFGIAKVHQEINLVKQLTVGQNITLGYEPKKGIVIDFKEMNQKVDKILKSLGCRFKSSDYINGLSVGEMQMIAIAKALYHNAKIISFDEPTSSLSKAEIDKLFEIIKELKANGTTIIYVSHKLDEIYEIVDRATILRDGKYIGTYDVASTPRKELIKKMIGRDVSSYAQRLKPPSVQPEVVLEVKGLSGNGFKDINFELHKGEILGIAGLVGAKRTEVVCTLFGAERKVSGVIRVKGKEVNIKSPEQALKLGIALLPEDRKTQGFIKYMSNADNAGIAALKKFCNGLVLNHRLKRKNFEYYADMVNINPSDPDILTENLSGGNQQKVILAKWLSTGADILIFDEPTKGIDIGAKTEIYALLETLASEGKSIIMVSSELPEIIGMCDNVLVMYKGRIRAKLKRNELTEEAILKYAIGE